MHPRWRTKCTWPDVEQGLDPGPGCQHDAQSAVRIRASACSHARYHLLLQHEVHVEDPLALSQQMKQQRCGDVVRQIPDQAQGASQSQLHQVKLEHVGCMQYQPSGCVTLLQMLDGIAIYLYRMQLTEPRQQGCRDCTEARTDLHHVFAALWSDGCDDALDDGRVMQEVLAEAFARMMHAGFAL